MPTVLIMFDVSAVAFEMPDTTYVPGEIIELHRQLSLSVESASNGGSSDSASSHTGKTQPFLTPTLHRRGFSW
jgi:hypothetical protein